MTEREIFLRCCEMLSGSGIREVRRLLSDAKEVFEAVMAHPNGAPKQVRRRKVEEQAPSEPLE